MTNHPYTNCYDNPGLGAGLAGLPFGYSPVKNRHHVPDLKAAEQAAHSEEYEITLRRGKK